MPFWIGSKMKLGIVKTVIFESLTRFCTLAVILLVSRNYSISDYGLFSLFVTVTSIGQTIIDFGSQNFGVKQLLKTSSPIEVISVVKSVMSFRYLGLSIWIAFSIIYSFFLE